MLGSVYGLECSLDTAIHGRHLLWSSNR